MINNNVYALLLSHTPHGGQQKLQWEGGGPKGGNFWGGGVGGGCLMERYFRGLRVRLVSWASYQSFNCEQSFKTETIVANLDFLFTIGWMLFSWLTWFVDSSHRLMNKIPVILLLLYYTICCGAVEPGFSERLYNDVLGITNDFLQPGQNYSKTYGTEPRFSEILVITNTIDKHKSNIYLYYE